MRVILATILGLGIASAARGQDVPALGPTTSSIEAEIRGKIVASPSDALRFITREFLTLAPEGVFPLSQEVAANEARLNEYRTELSRVLLDQDGDGDGMISINEFDTAQSTLVGQSIRSFRRDFFAADLDGDLNVTAQELTDFIEPQAQERYRISSSRIRHNQPLQVAYFDLNHDGVVVMEEIVDYVSLVARAAETAPTDFTNTGRCDLPEPQPGSIVTLIGHVKGAALSNVTVAGQDAVTRVVKLDIPEGTRPVYLLLAAKEPTIYEIGGATSRLSSVVLGHTNGAAGVVGADAHLVVFRTMSDCFPEGLIRPNGEPVLHELERLENNLGRLLDHIVADPSVERVDVTTGVVTNVDYNAPSAKAVVTANVGLSFEITDFSAFMDVPENPTPAQLLKLAVLYELRGAYPAGLALQDVSGVVSPGTPRRYEVLPGVAGLNNWLLLGAIRVAENAEELTLLSPVRRWPGDLDQALPKTVILGDGIPMPEGDPGNWTVYSAGRQSCLAGRGCP